MSSTLTVLNVLQRVFPLSATDPSAYMAWQSPQRSTVNDPLGAYRIPPLMPFDVFAITAHLLDLSGAYHHIWARMDSEKKGNRTPSRSEDEPRQVANRRIDVTASSIKECRKFAEIWRRDLGRVQNQGDLKRLLSARYARMGGLRDRWAELFTKHGASPVFQTLDREDPPPEWWSVAHELFMMADEACVGVGFTPLYEDAESGGLSKPKEMAWFEYLIYFLTIEKPREQRSVSGILTLSAADPDVLCVLPKARTTPVGCTMRSLSHHLALLPAQGIARGRWHHPPPGPAPRDDTALNLLLIPFPLEMEDDDFTGVGARSDLNENWGFFRVRQSWLSDPARTTNRLHNLIVELKQVACEQGAGSIDGIVFPELALSNEIYMDLLPRLKKSLPELELLIAGLSSYKHEGNFVAVTVFENAATAKYEGFMGVKTVREKHHRWKLDHHQILSYGLTGGLNPRFQWWEDIDLLSRRVDFTAFRRRSVLCAMICEDLARVDPCQELLRAVGPNLVVALLMDGPQLTTRWPARYATVLADDPGCSVLTLTSKALMNRQHRLKTVESKGPEDRVIALWRDDFHGRNIPIACPDDCQAVWLKVWASKVTDASLDGRFDNDGKTWTYGSHAPLSLPRWPERYRDLLKTKPN